MLIPPRRNDAYFFASAAGNIMIGIGFSKVYNYSFAKIKEIGNCQIRPLKTKKFLRTNLAEVYRRMSKKTTNIQRYKNFELGKGVPARLPASPKLQRGGGRTKEAHGERLALGAISNKADFTR